MKKVFLLALSGMVIAMAIPKPAMAEPIIVKDSTGKDQIVSVPDGKNPWLTGISSLIIPGLGELENGDWLDGSVILAGNIITGVALANETDSSQRNYTLATRAIIQIFSPIDAAMRSNKINDVRDKVIALYGSDLADSDKQKMLAQYSADLNNGPFSNFHLENIPQANQ